nr:hypothetical protein [Tanacetum cinerariifolium]
MIIGSSVLNIVVAPVPADLTSTHSLTIIDQDAPSPIEEGVLVKSAGTGATTTGIEEATLGGELKTINPVVAKQVALDNTLVAPDDRVKITKCNMRIDPFKTQKEPTYQVVLDTLSLSPCYPAFLITVDVPKIYMQ